MSLLLLSFFGGVLTILSPCVLPLLPVIVGGSLAAEHKLRPYIITVSLAASVVVFTLLLKWSTTLIDIPFQVWSTVSGVLVLALGIVTLFPAIWEKVSEALRLADRSNKALAQNARKESWGGAVLTGVALGPVFSSCSPTYALILATVLPQSFATGTLNLIAYGLGLASILLLIALFGQRVIQKVKWAADPTGWFKRVIGVLFVLVGLMIITGVDKKIETALVERGFGVTQIESRLVDDIGGNMVDQEDAATNSDDSDESESVKLNVRNPYIAPALQTGEWLNTDPLTLESLRGKVVIVDFWTYSCINCIRTLPVLNKWHTEYEDDGLVIIGVHAPEFSFERKPENVQKAIDQYDIQYPVALDNNFATWRAYKNRYWPAKYFIDKNGNVRHTHFGEGEYKESENVIRQLLAEEGGIEFDVPLAVQDIANDAPVVQGQTPETYCGLGRAERFVNRLEASEDAVVVFSDKQVKQDEWALKGAWKITSEDVVAQEPNVSIRMKFAAKSVYVVAHSQRADDAAITAKVLLNGAPIPAEKSGPDVVDGVLTVTNDRLYHIVELDAFTEGDVVEIVPQAEGIALNAFTFGSK